MRPTQKGLDTLRAALTVAQGKLEEAKGQALDDTRQTTGALVEATREQADVERREVQVLAELDLLFQEVNEAEKVLAALRLRHDKAEADHEAARARRWECDAKVSSLTGQLSRERESTAPLLRVRQGDVDRLSRRIQVREAHREARLSGLFPGDGSLRS